MNTPIRIGISMNYAAGDPARTLPERAYLDRHYFDVLAGLDAVPIPILPVEDDDCLDGILEMLDGVVFTGGLDLDAKLWHEPLHPEARLVHPRRQSFELDLYDAVRQRRLPILGICLGVQLINVAHGGSLYQHLPEEPGKVDHGREGHNTEHAIRLDDNSLLYKWLGAETVTVPSCHHQGIYRVGENLLAAGRTEDGVTEALEDPDYPFLLAVQWHPERAPDRKVNRLILENFIEAARS